MKRRISLLLFLVLALILNACGGSEKEASQVQEVKEVKESEYSVTDVRGKTIKFEKTPEKNCNGGQASSVYNICN